MQGSDKGERAPNQFEEVPGMARRRRSRPRRRCSSGADTLSKLEGSLLHLKRDNSNYSSH